MIEEDGGGEADAEEPPVRVSKRRGGKLGEGRGGSSRRKRKSEDEEESESD